MKNFNLVTLFVALVLCSTLHAQNDVTWSNPVDVAAASSGNLHPRVVLDAQGNPVVMFGHQGTNRILVSRWNGTAFASPILANSVMTPAFYESWAGPDIAARGDTMYIVYKQTPEEKNHVYCVRSVDGGRSFSNPVPVENIADSLSRFPAVGIDANGQPIVAFMKFNSDYTRSRWAVCRSTDFGMSWKPDVLASGFSGGTVCDCCPGTVRCSATGDIAMLYRDNLNNLRDTWVGISHNGGQNFSKGLSVDQQGWMINACPATGPSGTIIGDSLYSVFTSAASGPDYVYHNVNCISTEQSSKSTKIITTSSSITSQNYPRVSSFGNTLAEVWVQGTASNSSIMMCFSPDVHAGRSSSPITVANSGITAMVNADVCVGNGKVYVVYQDNGTGTVRMRRGVFSVSDVETNDNPSPAIIMQSLSSSSQLRFRLREVASDTYTCTVLNTLGQVILRQSLEANALEQTLDCSRLSRGTYFMEIPAKNGIQRIAFSLCD